MSKKVNREDILHIAKLSKLKLTDAEVENFENEINSILEYVEKINECETGDIKTSHHLSSFTDEVLAEDEVKDSLPLDKLIKSLGKDRFKNGYIKTSKIVSKD